MAKNRNKGKSKSNKSSVNALSRKKGSKDVVEIEVVPKDKRSHSFSSSWWIASIFALIAGVFTPPTIDVWNVYWKNHGNSLKSDAKPKLQAPPSASPSNDRAVENPIRVPTDCNLETSLELQGFVTEQGLRGMHILCFHDSNKLTIFKHSTSNKIYDNIVLFEDEYTSTWKGFKDDILEPRLMLNQRRYPVQPWAMFSKDGLRLLDEQYNNSADSKVLHYFMREQGIIVIMEGGQWFWPGVHEGYIRKIKLNDETKEYATLETLSVNPLVLSVDSFLTDEECDFIQETATPMMEYSAVTLMDKDKGRPASDFRTSQSTFLGPTHQKMYPIDYRTASLVRIPRSHQEHAQVLRYGYTEKYNAHHDYFDPKLYQNDPNTLRMIENGKKNRLATVFWYLSDVAKGGETIFPRFQKGPPPRNPADCTVGLKVKPERGKVIIFYSMTPEGTTDPFSQHGACPVEEGIKWAANKWVWNKPTGFYPFSDNERS